MDEGYTELGLLLSDCYAGALSQWRDSYAPSKRPWDLLANDVRVVKVACNVLPAGVVDIMVRVQARNTAFHEIYFWKAQRVAGKYVILD